nr:uncharacterized protein CTRU02_03681 [Colletotrichum truncatum]KAF6796703.1 hypothetical protein CTRU02_03681 [Colletotrichum truncatum]
MTEKLVGGDEVVESILLKLGVAEVELEVNSDDTDENGLDGVAVRLLVDEAPTGDGALAIVELDRDNVEDDGKLAAVDALAVDEIVDDELTFEVGSGDMGDSVEDNMVVVEIDDVGILEWDEEELVDVPGEDVVVSDDVFERNVGVDKEDELEKDEEINEVDDEDMVVVVVEVVVVEVAAVEEVVVEDVAVVDVLVQPAPGDTTTGL